MKIKAIDHLVITTADLDKCLAFYVGILGMELDESNNRYTLRFGESKFNIYTRKAEFLPAAQNPAYGSLDLCLRVDESIDEIVKEIEAKGYPIEEGPVIRHGALGTMQSVYLRDYDGNLIEISSYN
ncbi:VOC family protein [Veillonella ratti]|uniref:VOC family protein n=1 Tax=Veillonella ratti TaxID=103892 RepID=UPI0013DF4C36|nr:VOC family protein [Veillonella ratti]